jgi:methionine-rich copper-binding protein CopC
MTATVDNFGVPVLDTTPPTITALSPTNNATGVAAYANLSATFSESIQKGTGNITLKKSSDNSTVETFDAATSPRLTFSGLTLTIDPTNILAGLTGYYVQIDTTAVTDISTNAFAGITDTTTWTFTTGVADTTAPVISTLSPADDATDGGVAANLVATFDETIRKGTGNITLKKSSDNATVETFDVATSPRLTVSGATLTIDPTSNLAATTGYYVEIASTAIQNLHELSFAGISDATTWNFTTVAIPADYTWINTSSGASGYWTNSANWIGGTYPRPAAGDSAFMTNTIASGAYTGILDTTLSGTLAALKISNSGAGQARLIVTNAALMVGTFTLGNGGVLEIAANGAVTNNATANANWWTGSSGTIQLNDGGKYATVNAVTLGASLSNVKATVGTTGTSGGSWDLAAKALTLGGGSGTVTNNILLVAGSGVAVTNVGITGGRSGAYNGLTLGYSGASSSGNSLIISNGARVAVSSGWALSDLDASGNRMLVDNGTLTAPAYIIGWANIGPAYGLNNSLTVTNGGYVGATGTNGLALGNGGPGLAGFGSSGNTVIVAGTNSLGAKATISLNGGSLSIANATGGTGSTRAANSNLVLIGNGGIIANAGAVTVGVSQNSTGNSLILTNGGQLFSANTSSIGDAGNTNSVLVVGGSGGISHWSLGNQMLNVGAGGGIGNVLRVDGAGMIGGAMVTNVSSLYLAGTAGSLVITNGGQLFASNESRVGSLGCINNRMVVDNGTFSSGSGLFVGLGSVATGGSGGTNSLTVANGGSFSATTLWLGSYPQAQGFGCSSNTVTVAGTNSTGGQATINLKGGNLAIGNGQGAKNNLLLVGNGGIITNVGSIVVTATNTLSLGAGGQVYAVAVTNAGTLTVGIDSATTPMCGSLTVSGNLNITGAALSLEGKVKGTGVHIIARYGTVTGSFAVTNGLPPEGRLDYAYGDGKQIAVIVPPQGAMFIFF